ncbi:hypothetical protein [Fusibacter sp. 3D3]|uniref:hypothetical protein n=1 Tax=Fusibacter sp. 3D3 TaxID=1048380 RepID=UPI001112E6F6|nr:hypothetical protein [Fusibacter sp. 3D3]
MKYNQTEELFTRQVNISCSEDNFSALSVQQFAQQISLPAGIVVGRLQHDGYVPFTNLNKMKIKLNQFNQLIIA